MSDVETLNKEIEQHKLNAQGNAAQLDAHKQMLNEYINGALILRANMILMQKQTKDLMEKNAALIAQIHTLSQQLSDAGIEKKT